MKREPLPDRLTSGMRLRSKTGHIVEVVRTTKKDNFDEPLYRLRDAKYKTTSSQLWSRDELESEEVEII